MGPLHAMRIRVRTRPAALAALGLLLVGGVTIGSAADPFQAGQRATRPAGLSDLARAAALARADGLVRALGIDVPGPRAAARIEDRFEGRLVDEVTIQDAHGQPAVILRIGLDGRLRQAVRLGWHQSAIAVDRATAISQARALADAAGLAAVGEPLVDPEPDGGGWSVHWDRTVDEAPVPGDGTWVRLWADGTFHGASEVRSELRAAPSATRSAADARRIADGYLGRWFPADARPDIAIAEPALAWVAPNDMFEPSLPDAPDAVRRLAWVVRATMSGPTAERVRAIELDLDAGDLTLLGGDALR